MEKPIRILQIVTHMNRGGAETMLMNYYRQIDRSKVQFDFMVHREAAGAYDREIESLGGKIYKMPSIHPNNLRLYFQKLNIFFSEHKEYRVIHSHLDTLSTFVLRAAERASVPVRIAHSHNTRMDFDLKMPFRFYSRSQLKKYCTHYFACGKEAGNWLFGKNADDKTQILNNAIDIEKYIYNNNIAEEIKNKLNIRDKFVIGHIGRFNKQKNHDFIVDIFKEIYKKEKDAVLLLIGDGHLKENIKQKVDLLGLTEVVMFLGVRNDIPMLLNAIDVFLFPSLYEGLPVALIEAQASGLNCIISDTISSESNISGNLKFLSIKDTPKSWSECVLKYKNCESRVNLHRKIADAGYGIKENAVWLENFYINKYHFGR